MFAQTYESSWSDCSDLSQCAVLDLIVRNHPGVMSHICGLFSRRAYNVEGIICLPIGNGETSRVSLFVNENERLDQIIRQLKKLSDVLDIKTKNGE